MPRPAIGLYALYSSDKDGARPWHVGYSRRVQGDITRYHVANSGGPAAHFARVKLLGSEPKMWTRARLEDLRRTWAQELGGDAESDGARSPVAEAEPYSAEDALTPLEKRAFEEQKWKLQLAMGRNLDDAVVGEEESAAQRRRNFLRAVEGDDWSSVVNEQTLEAISKQTAEVAAPHEPRSASPFSMRAPGQAGSAGRGVSKELTTDNVKEVLEALRPVLLADGGDIEVLGVNRERGVVMLGLMGACMTCPAAPATMESGIEKALYDHFGRDVVREVVRIDSGAAAVSDEGIRQGVESHLSTLQGSLGREGASARLVQNEELGEGGPIEVEFSGPPMLFQLVQSSLTYRFPELAGRLRVRHATAA